MAIYTCIRAKILNNFVDLGGNFVNNFVNLVNNLVSNFWQDRGPQKFLHNQIYFQAV